MSKLIQTYLGDGLYAEHDGHQIRLHTMRRAIRHEIYLDDYVIDAFLKWLSNLKEQNMTSKFGFGDALRFLDDGEKVKRSSWNGKDQYVFLDHNPRSSIPDIHYQPVLVIRNQQGLYQPGWLATQADMLAQDWEIVDDS